MAQASSQRSPYIETFQLDVFPGGRRLSACLVTGVENAKELRAEIQQRKFEASLLSADMVADTFHLLVAASKAMNGLVNNCMTTHGIHTELIHCLSGAKSIVDALNNFGIREDSKSIVVAIFDEGEPAMEEVLAHVHGVRAPLMELGSLCNRERLMKMYKIQPQELALPGSSLSECAACRIAIRDSL